MASKKFGVLFSVIIAMILLSSVLVSATLEIKKEVVSSVAIKELNLPAIFQLQITNLGETDNFSIYSLVGIDLEPKENFSIAHGETKAITLKAYPTLPIKVSPNYFSFNYKISGKTSGIQNDEVAITIVNLKDAFDFYVEDLSPTSDKAIVHFNNKAGHNLNNINLKLYSVFFDQRYNLSLEPFEKKTYEIKIDKNKTSEIVAGSYIISADITLNSIETTATTVAKFQEMPGIETTETIEGFILIRREIEKFNKGNVNTDVTITITKDLFSSIFTSFNVPYQKKEVQGFRATYIFNNELAPGRSLEVVAKTNWWILIGLIVAIILIWYVVERYIKAKLVLTKRVGFVHTRGGEFALKVTVHVKARNFVEKIRIIDRLPPMVKLFDRYGSTNPDRIDEKSRRLEWNINALRNGEERVFSYIIYSKIGVMGRFELPPAGALYEFEGNLKEASSNPAFFNNDAPRKE